MLKLIQNWNTKIEGLLPESQAFWGGRPGLAGRGTGRRLGTRRNG